MTSDPKAFRSGYVAILGKPNAGKSTLMNALVGQKVAIVSDKPQTTRDRIAGIVTTDDYQIVFLDTPGIIEPKDRFNETLMARVGEALDSADVIYHLVDATDRDENAGAVAPLLKQRRKAARFLVVNKIDKFRGSKKEPFPKGIDPADYDLVFMISALAKKGLDALLKHTVERMPEGPHYYDPEQLSDRDERFLASEIVREKVFRRTGAEIPYSVFIEVDTFEEKPDKDFIRMTIYVERDSQKGIIIGEGGRTLKQIGQDARRDIEKATGRPLFLELWVKVRKNWRRDEAELAKFGFKAPKKKRK